jgi:multiple sugar transport system permease protein
MLYPLLWMISSSFKPESLIFKEMGLIPSQVTFENYTQGWSGKAGLNFTVFFRNTIFLVILCIIGNLVSGTMTAYAFARLRFVGKNVLFGILMVSMMLPFHVVLLPRFFIFTKLGWVDSYLPLVVPKFLATEGFFCYLLVQFMRGIPRELDEAATVDGCGPIQLFLRIILPLCKSSMVLVVVFTLIWTWNDFFSQLIYIGNPNKFTVALGLRTFIDATGVSHYGQMFAMSVATLIPILIFFIMAQKQLIEGVATTGLKG